MRIMEFLLRWLARARPWRRRRICARPRAPRRGHRPCRARLAPRRDRQAASVFNSRRASVRSLRSAAAVTRATMLPRSLPTASARCTRTSFAAPACRRSIMPLPVVAVSAAGGASFGTMATELAAQRGRVRHAGRGKCFERFQAHRHSATAPWRRQARCIGIAVPHRHVEQGRRHDTAQAASSAGLLSADLARQLGLRRLDAGDLGLLRLRRALDLRDALVDGGKIHGGRGGIARRCLHIVDGGGKLVGLRARGSEFAAQRGDAIFRLSPSARPPPDRPRAPRACSPSFRARRCAW